MIRETLIVTAAKELLYLISIVRANYFGYNIEKIEVGCKCSKFTDKITRAIRRVKYKYQTLFRKELKNSHFCTELLVSTVSKFNYFNETQIKINRIKRRMSQL